MEGMNEERIEQIERDLKLVAKALSELPMLLVTLDGLGFPANQQARDARGRFDQAVAEIRKVTGIDQ